ncbi:carboxyl-terminal processing protease [Candidatus Symbiothrix dinenymphae]|nr:carboxyl-terminal processing protease [Candidatus Symbiothrix dinenymphae]
MKHTSFSLVLAASLLLNTSCTYGQRGMNDPATQKIAMTVAVIENLYVDHVDKEKLANDAVIALLKGLDPHSAYMTPEEVKEMNEPLQGNFDGIGVQFNVLTDTIYVVQVIAGGPSEKVGLLAGDRIIYIDDTLMVGDAVKHTTSVTKKLRGLKGTTVNVKVKRGSNPNLMSFNIVRDKIPLYSLDASYMLNKTAGYIKLSRFAATTYEEFKTALAKLQAQGMKDLVLDLQDNSGGYLEAAIQVANEFLQSGNLIVYTEGVHQKRDDAKADMRGSLEKGKVVVLIDESSASASEIVTGALQDWDRAVVVGRRSFGKGLVQRPIPLPDGSMLKLTTARYYTPTGRCIQKPYENGNMESYQKDMITRYNHGEMLSADSIHFPDSLRYSTLVTKRTVYGGGGIMPDYFVPIDTTRYTDMHRSLMASGVIFKQVMNLIDKNRKSYQTKYPNIATFKAKYEVTDAMIDDLLSSLKKADFDMIVTGGAAPHKSTHLTDEDLKQLEKSKPLIQNQIKALVARDIWNMSEYYQIHNEIDDVLKQAIKLLENPKEYDKLLSGK